METLRTNDQIQQLIPVLSSKDGLKRESARKALEKIGKPAAPALVGLLASRNQHLRWEACKALGTIKDPASAGYLVDALSDDSSEIRWLAAEALIALDTRALEPLLKALAEHFNSIMLRQGAHHILHAFEREQLLNRKTKALLDSIRSLSPTMPVAVAAQEALLSMTRSKRRGSA